VSIVPVIHLATEEGLLAIDDVDGGVVRETALGGRQVVAVAAHRGWLAAATADGEVIRRSPGSDPEPLGRVDEIVWAMALEDAGEVLVGLEPAGLVRLDGGGRTRLDGLDSVEGHDQWHSPWGPPDLCAIAVDGDRLVVGVEIGGVCGSQDRGRTWTSLSTGLFEDVHAVVIDGDRWWATTGMGVHHSADAGRSWRFVHGSIDRGYTQGLALGSSHIVVASSSGPPPLWSDGGPEAALFVADRQAATPEWTLTAEGFAGNVERGALAAVGGLVVAGTDAGEVLVSTDDGLTWTHAVHGLAPIRAVAIEA
jgi:hypothetical protein